MVTHDMRMAKYVDKVIQMEDGRITDVIYDKKGIAMLTGVSSNMFPGERTPDIAFPQEDPTFPVWSGTPAYALTGD